MVNYAVMFNVLEGGVVEPIDWNTDQLKPDRSIIILDELNMSLYLWHGSKQGLVARRTALRQAESLKGHGYSVGKSIIGRDIKEIKEIDARKVTRVPHDTELNEELQNILNKKLKKLDNFIVTFDLQAPDTSVVKKKEIPVIKKEVKPSPKPEAAKPRLAAPIVKAGPIDEPSSKPDTSIEEDETVQAKVSFVLISILEHFSDIWISKKKDGTYAVEMMDGPICSFSISEDRIKFSSNSFTGISTNIKNAIQQKFIKLNKLLK